MLASHYGVVVQQDKVALTFVPLLQPTIAGSVLSNMEIRPTPELLGTQKLTVFSFHIA
jgi:hypothetical protein